MLYPNQIMLEPQAVPTINLVVPLSLIHKMIEEYMAAGNLLAIEVLMELIRRVSLDRQVKEDFL